MLTNKELVEALREIDADSEVARLSGVTPKTVYRIRTQDDYSPAMKTAEKLIDAIRVIRTLGAKRDREPV